MFLNLFKPKLYREGFLPVSEEHSIYYAEYGNPDGEPIIAFHGGPGYYSSPGQAERFNLKTCRVILFDQRGCGKSTPSGEINKNTTTDLIQDAAALLDHLAVEKISIYGASWGSTLALLFAQKYPERVKKMLLAKIFLARHDDVEWIATETEKFYPEIMAELKKHVPEGKSLRRYYAEKILSSNPNDQIHSTKLYGVYEGMIGKLEPRFSDDIPSQKQLEAYRIYMHYDLDDYGVTENEILDNIGVIKHIPTAIVHNRMDMVCPVNQAWALHKAMPVSELIIVPDYGHGSKKLNKAITAKASEFFTS